MVFSSEIERAAPHTAMAAAVPYSSQWETPELTSAVIAEGSVALRRDPLWRQSGAETIDEYQRWAVNLCGMACLKMVLAARGETHPLLDLARACTAYGGYVVNEADGAIKGLIYAPFTRFVGERFELDAEVVTQVDVADLASLLKKRPFFMASVHHTIRRPEDQPPAKGGHLVLVTAATETEIRFHNPSGHDRVSQIDVTLPIAVFDQFFANRGVSLGGGAGAAPRAPIV
jgi:hypothetical protein